MTDKELLRWKLKNVEYIITNKGASKIINVPIMGKMLSILSKVRSNMRGDVKGNQLYRPFSSVSYYRILENGNIILVSYKNRIMIDSDFLIIPNNNIKEITRILDSYILRKE